MKPSLLPRITHQINGRVGNKTQVSWLPVGGPISWTPLLIQISGRWETNWNNILVSQNTTSSLMPYTLKNAASLYATPVSQEKKVGSQNAAVKYMRFQWSKSLGTNIFNRVGWEWKQRNNTKSSRKVKIRDLEVIDNKFFDRLTGLVDGEQQRWYLDFY